MDGLESTGVLLKELGIITENLTACQPLKKPASPIRMQALVQLDKSWGTLAYGCVLSIKSKGK